MTTKPRVKRYHIRREARRDAAAAATAGATANANETLNPLEQLAQQPHEDGFPAEGFQTARATGSTENPKTAEQELEEIKAEGLTGRQLRMARRIAQKHGFQPESDHDAVRMLRQAGIDPFDRANMLEIVGGASAHTSEPPTNLPQTVPIPQVPATGPLNEADRALSVMEIQQDIAKRRRRKLRNLVLRLIAFVLLPTIVAGYYYYNVATSMYATKSEFVIQKADGAAGGFGGLFAGSGFATSQDSITVQSYLTSRDAMLRLDADHGYKAHFADTEIDSIQRLDADATNEAAYALYKKNVKIGFDPTEGIIKMEVIATSPEASAEFSEALISYAEERVDQLTQRLREDQLKGSRESFEDAERKMLEAEAEVLRLQESLGVFDANSDAAAVMGQINGYELQLQDKRLALEQLLDNTRPNQARVDGIRGDISRLEKLVAELRAKLTDKTDGNGSVASISGRLRVAQTNLQTRTMMMQASLEQLESARIEANKQTRYLELGVRPVAPDEPTYPRAFVDTLLAFFIFAGAYLMISLTAAVLREQVSA